MPAARKSQPLKERPQLLVPRAEFEQQLTERIDLGEALLDVEITARVIYDEVRGDYRLWDEYNVTLIESAFTTSEEADTYKWWPGIAVGTDDLQEQIKELTEDIEERVRRLKSFRGRLALFAEASTVAAPSRPTKPGPTQRAIFLVHGRDNAAKYGVARFVHSVTGITPIILAEQPNLGQTIIEKFERHALNVSFAIVLLTADDEGRLKDAHDLKPRARQNVVLELGWFIGAIKRENVAILCEPRIELPSDTLGLAYISLTGDDGWKLQLAKEMKSSGLPVDPSKLL
jgi:predicted nucleotide-binding protein